MWRTRTEDGGVTIIKNVKIDEMSHIRDQFDNDNSDDDFWTHEDDKLLNSNFEIDDSSTNISSVELMI
jgi:hypothetical protein